MKDPIITKWQEWGKQRGLTFTGCLTHLPGGQKLTESLPIFVFPKDKYNDINCELKKQGRQLVWTTFFDAYMSEEMCKKAIGFYKGD